MNTQEILYRAETDPNDANRTKVFAIENGHERKIDLAPEDASYEGHFTWGYAGTGPSNLSRAIVWDYFRDDPDRRNKANAAWRPLLDNLISSLPQNLPNWEITRGMIRAAITQQRRSAHA